MTLIRYVCLWVRLSISLPIHLWVMSCECDLKMVFYISYCYWPSTRKKEGKYNLSKCIVYALGIGNMLFINVWIKNSKNKVNSWKCSLRLESERAFHLFCEARMPPDRRDWMRTDPAGLFIREVCNACQLVDLGQWPYCTSIRPSVYLLKSVSIFI